MTKSRNSSWAARQQMMLMALLLTAFSMIVLTFPTDSRAQEDIDRESSDVYAIEPITVTAEKREQDLQDVPASISVLSATELKNADIKSVNDLWLTVPNLYILDYGDTFEQTAYIRGVKGAIGFNVDEINYFGGITGLLDIPLNDIERVEVLRGPQGTLYGRNTEGGVINVITKKPDNETHGFISSGVGNHDLWETRGGLRLPVVKDKLFLSLSGGSENQDGFTHNDFRDEDVDNKERAFGRANLRWMPADNLDIQLILDKDRYEMGVPTYARLDSMWDDPYHVAFDKDGNDVRDIWGSTLKIDYDMPWFKLTSITGYREWDQDHMSDGDWTPSDEYTWEYIADQQQYTQEVRLASNDGSALLKWLVGAYYWKDQLDTTDDMRYGADNTWGMTPDDGTYTLAGVTSEGYAFFGQTTYTLFDRIDLTAGIRYENEQKKKSSKDYYDSPIAGIYGQMTGTYNEEAEYSEWLPKAAVAYRCTEDFMTYISVAKGYKSGGFNRSFVTDAMTYDPEYTWNYEAGFKTTWLDRKLGLNAALFYIDYKEMQISQADPSSGRWYTSNAGEAHSLGGEIEAVVRPMPGLDFMAGFGYAKAIYDKYAPDAGVDYKGNYVVQAPRFNFNAAAQYRRPLTADLDVVGRVDVQGVGDRYWDNANTEKADPFALVNTRLGVEKKPLGVYFWVRNLFDTEYERVAFDYNGLWATPGEPVTFGVTVAAYF